MFAFFKLVGKMRYICTIYFKGNLYNKIEIYVKL